jgi:hypothetical protein
VARLPTDQGRVARAEHPQLAADAEALYESLVTFRAAVFQIFEQSSTAGHHTQQTAPRVMVLLMSLEMLSQVKDALTQNSYLNLWRTRVGLVNPIFTNYLRLLL